MAEKEATCLNCAFSTNMQSEKGIVQLGTVFCDRYPPVIVGGVVLAKQSAFAEPSPQIISNGVRPMVPESHWCGEYQEGFEEQEVVEEQD